MPAAHYEIRCDVCHKSNIDWSEYEGLIWCYDCETDTKGEGGVFDGPISLRVGEMIGLSFDRIDLATGEILKCLDEDHHLVWKPTGTFVKMTAPARPRRRMP